MEIVASHPLTLTTLHFDLPLASGEIPAFRKLVNRFIGADDDRFHNHRENGQVFYRYPVVQYKSVENRAALFGLGESGANALQKLSQQSDFRRACLHLSDDFSNFLLTEQRTDTLSLHSTPLYAYRLSNYIALNEKNLLDWVERPALTARSMLLERCIVGHILKFCSAIQWLLPPKSLQVELMDFRFQQTRVFDNNFIAFDVLFRSNITLPDSIGLGKAVSHGFGMVTNETR